jgi:DnaJ like chaperone protein
MGYWGKIIGGVAGFAMGGPMGAVVGAALGHAADTGVMPNLRASLGPHVAWNPARIAAVVHGRDQLFAVCVVVIAAKLAKCDAPVNRQEIDTFKRLFRIAPDAMRDVGRLFDQARDSSESADAYAMQLGDAFADNRGMLEEVLNALFAIARADSPVNARELAFLSRMHQGLGLGQAAWDRARGGSAPPPRQAPDEADAYTVLGVSRSASADEIRATWKRLMRENHPDSLAARGVPAEFIARANEKVARINAAWDRIKRERGL